MSAVDIWDEAWDVISAVRDALPRVPGDTATSDIVNALVEAGLLVKEKL